MSSLLLLLLSSSTHPVLYGCNFWHKRH